MSSVESLLKDIKNKKTMPVYFLAGEEAFYMDQITAAIETNVLSEEEKGFNQTILYGQDVDLSQLIGIAKQYPMGADKAVVILKEGQHLSRSIDQLDEYVKQVQESTVLVFNYKGKQLDKRSKLYKSLQSKGYYFEFKKLYDNQIPDWIEQKVKENRISIEPKAKFLLAEYVGADLSRLNNELEKLFTIVHASKEITAKDIEHHIGISKDYNNFELRKALETKNVTKAFEIIHYFEKNQKDNPIQATLSIVFNLYTSIILYHTLTDKSKPNVAKELGIHPFFVQDIAIAAQNYPLKKATRIISFIREYDVKSKGVNVTGNVSSSELLIELIYKIVNL